MADEKKPLAFGFSKIKAKTTLVKTDAAVKTFSLDEKTKANGGEFELIKSIEGKKITSINGASSGGDKKQPLVIPCEGNKLVFDIQAKMKAKEAAQSTSSSDPVPMDTQQSANMSQEDLEAIKQLLADTEKRKASKDENTLVIKADENKNHGDEKEEEIVVEEPDYEKIEIEKFGLAALRGMGWSEKDGIGLTNKRKTTFVEPELRPKGLGLGAGSAASAKKQRSNEEDQESSLRYVKGAYVRIEGDRNHDGKCGQIVGFDDGMNRVLIKLAPSGENVSFIQFSTKLITKDEYRRLTEKRDETKKAPSSSSSSSSSHRHSQSSSSHSSSHYSSSSSSSSSHHHHRPSSSSSSSHGSSYSRR